MNLARPSWLRLPSLPRATADTPPGKRAAYLALRIGLFAALLVLAALVSLMIGRETRDVSIA